jgi:hypothetical protein
MIVIAAPNRYPLGYVGRGLTDTNGLWHPDQAFEILREATQKEWEDCVHSYGGEPVLPSESGFFYEVSVD